LLIRGFPMVMRTPICQLSSTRGSPMECRVNFLQSTGCDAPGWREAFGGVRKQEEEG